MLPDYLDGKNLFAADHEPRTHVISARDRCDYTIDRSRTVRTDKLRYIRNYFPDRPMLQAQYRDNHATVKDLKRLHEAGELSEYQDTFWFGLPPRKSSTTSPTILTRSTILPATLHLKPRSNGTVIF